MKEAEDNESGNQSQFFNWQNFKQARPVLIEDDMVNEDMARAVDGLPWCYWRLAPIDGEFVFVAFNKAAETMTGLSRRQLLGKSAKEFDKLSVFQDASALDDAVRTAIKDNPGELTHPFDLTVAKDGSKRIIFAEIHPSFDERGRARYIDLIGLNQPHPKRLKPESDQVWIALRQLVETANTPIISIDKHGLVNEWNRSAQVATGYTRAEMLGRHLVKEVLQSEQAAGMKRVLDDALRGVEASNYECTFNTRDDQRVVLLLNATSLRDDEGEIIGVICVGQDISKLKKVQAEGNRKAMELRQFMETANTPIIGIDERGMITEWNQMTAQITGYLGADVLGKDLAEEFVPPFDKASVKQVLTEALRGKETSNYEFQLRKKDGGYADILLNATTRRSVDGKIIGMIGVGQDITETKAKGKALQQAQKLEAIGQLTGGIAHDFNNLLTIIQGNIGFLRDELGELTSEQEEVLADALSATADGKKLTSQLLAFARRQSLAPEKVDLIALIEHTIRLVSRTLGKGISINFRPGITEAIAMIDTAQLESSLLNLCLNARDATSEKGKITITIDAVESKAVRSKDPASGDYVRITVADTGTGIPPQILDQVFEPFYTTKDLGKGSGLGLSMVMGFVQQSKGEISIDSELGEGTRVSMILPIISYRSAHSHPAKEHLKILIVEDDERVSKFAVRCLTSARHTVVTASSAPEALLLLKKVSDFDILFSDIVMPGSMSGRELAEIVSAEYPKIKVQLATGFEDIRRQVSDGDRFPVLNKPYGKDELLASIHKLISCELT